jgi:hypothetical protein
MGATRFAYDSRRIDWDWLDREIAPLYSDKGRPGIETRFVFGLLLLKSDACRPPDSKH